MLSLGLTCPCTSYWVLLLGQALNMQGRTRELPSRSPQSPLGPWTSLWNECWSSTPSTKCSGREEEQGTDCCKKAGQLHRRQWHLGQVLKEFARRGRVGSPSRQKEHSHSKPQSEKAHGGPVKCRVLWCHLSRG